MGWSGYYQILCENGHYHERDGYEEPNLNNKSEENFYGDVEEPWKCSICEAFCSWWNLVDTTNGLDEEKETYVTLVEKTKEVTEQCNLGHWHIVEPATFEIPKKLT